MTPTAHPARATPLADPKSWEPVWSPEETDPALPPLTLILDPHDHAALTSTALAAHRPSAGRVTVHPTLLALTGTTCAHDLVRAYGKHLPAPEDLHPQPAWAHHTDDSWRNTAAWTTALGITHLTICRAHRLHGGYIQYLLALREHARLKLTLLYHGAVPPNVRPLFSAVRHHTLDTPESALRHLQQPLPPPTTGAYPWWQAHPAFPARAEETWFRLPTPPSDCRHRWEDRHHTMTATQPPPDARILPLPPTRHDHTHPHLAPVIARIHNRIAHPVHAARVALHLLTGAPPDQLNHLSHAELTSTSTDHEHHPAIDLPPWVHPLIQAALALTELRGYRHADNPLYIPKWEEHEVSQALEHCRLLLPRPAPTPAATRKRPARRR